MLEFSNLVLSYHNFEETPENLMELLSEMANLTPRVVKVAVMPKNEQDVLDLMNFTRGFKAVSYTHLDVYKRQHNHSPRYEHQLFQECRYLVQQRSTYLLR